VKPLIERNVELSEKTKEAGSSQAEGAHEQFKSAIHSQRRRTAIYPPTDNNRTKSESSEETRQHGAGSIGGVSKSVSEEPGKDSLKHQARHPRAKEKYREHAEISERRLYVRPPFQGGWRPSVFHALFFLSYNGTAGAPR